MAAHRTDLCITLLLVLTLAAAGCRPRAQRQAEDAPLQLTLAIHAAPYSGLIAVADEKGYFEKVGLKVEFKVYPSGFDSLMAMMRGEAQVATVADIAFASALDEDPSLRVIAAIGASTGSQIVARKDRNIHAPADLRESASATAPALPVLTSCIHFS